MLNTISITSFFACFLIYMVSGISYAETYTVPVSINCSSSIEGAGWKHLNGDPKQQLTLTTEGMYIKGEGLIKLWDDDDEANDYENSVFHTQIVGDSAIVIAECVSFGGETQMYSYVQGENPPVLACPKGDGIKMRFISPNAPDPEQYVYHATLTVVKDDEPTEKMIIGIKAKDDIKGPQVNFGKQFPTSTEKSELSSGSKNKPSKCIIMSAEPPGLSLYESVYNDGFYKQYDNCIKSSLLSTSLFY